MSSEVPIEMLDRRSLNRGGNFSSAVRMTSNGDLCAVLISLPVWLVDALDEDARQRGCSRNYLINLYLDESFSEDPDHVPTVERFERVVDAHGCIVKQAPAVGKAVGEPPQGGQ